MEFSHNAASGWVWLCVVQQQMQGQQHLPLAAHLPSLPLAPHAAAAAAAAAAGINAGGAAGLMSMAGRLPSSSGHMHSSGRTSSGVKEEKGALSFCHLCTYVQYKIRHKFNSERKG